MSIIKIITTFRDYMEGRANEKDMREAVAAAIDYIEKRLSQITKI